MPSALPLTSSAVTPALSDPQRAILLEQVRRALVAPVMRTTQRQAVESALPQLDEHFDALLRIASRPAGDPLADRQAIVDEICPTCAIAPLDGPGRPRCMTGCSLLQRGADVVTTIRQAMTKSA
jgi:hypothetical protein